MLKLKDNPLKNPEFCSGVAFNFRQFGLHLKNGILFGVESELDGIGGVHKINRIIEYRRYRDPIKLEGKLSKREVEILKKLIEQTTTHKYPRVEQLTNLNRLSDSADTVRTQAILKFCFDWRGKNGCDKCPMFVSELACIEYVNQNVVPHFIINNGKQYSQVIVNDAWMKKSFTALVHKYREYINWEQFKRLVEKIRERQVDEFGDFRMEKYSGDEK